jgi:hypothetical protein
MRRLLPTLALVLGADLFAASAVEAQSKPSASAPDRAEAKRRLWAGRRLLAAKKPEKALVEFEASFALDPQPAALEGMGDSQAALGKNVAAYASFERALVQPGDPLLAQEREQVKKSLAKAASKTAVVTVRCDVDGASVEFDGAIVGTTPLPNAVRVELGSHVVRLQKPRYVAATDTVVVTGGESKTLQLRLEKEQSVATIVVRAAGGVPADVYVDGLRVGPAPQTLSAGAGTYSITLVVGSTSSSPRVVAAAVGASEEVELEPPTVATKSAPPDDGACATDDDCADGERCSKGVCRVRKKRKKPRANPDESEEGESCVTRACGPGLTCSEDLCKKPEDVRQTLRGSVGGVWQITPGLSGVAKYPVPLHALALRVEVPLAAVVRWNLLAGYANLSARGGFKLMPLGFSFPISVWESDHKELWVEPGVDVLNVFGVFDDHGHDFVLGSAVWARVSLHVGSLFVAAEPFGLEVPFMRVSGNSKSTNAFAESSVNYVVRLGGGIHF